MPVNTCASPSAQGMVRRRGNRVSLWCCSYRVKHSLARLGTAVADGICTARVWWECGGVYWYRPVSWKEAVFQYMKR